MGSPATCHHLSLTIRVWEEGFREYEIRRTPGGGRYGEKVDEAEPVPSGYDVTCEDCGASHSTKKRGTGWPAKTPAWAIEAAEGVR